MNRRFLYLIVFFITLFVTCQNNLAQSINAKPNIIFILIDDMGYGDLSCYGNTKVKTPNFDRLAASGVKFTQFYVNSPVCSPSRVALMTGQYPQRWDITSYLSSRKENTDRKLAHYLDPKAPSLGRVMKSAGYATGHFGKWHLGGGRDVGDAPHPSAYGFDQSLVNMEGLGDRILEKGLKLADQSATLGQGKMIWAEKHEMTRIYIDSALAFIGRNKEKPFYINLWPGDVHDMHQPQAGTVEKFASVSSNPYEQKFFAVLEETDRQLGRLLDGLEAAGVAGNTLVVLTSDNGPTDWPMYYQAGQTPPGSTAHFYGRKWSLYEGGIRVPFMVSWKRKFPVGLTDSTTVGVAFDLFPSLCQLARIPLPQSIKPDGVDISAAFYGKPLSRKKDICWEYPNLPKPGKAEFVSPQLAIRSGDWKLLMEKDGTGHKLFNLATDPGERHDLTREKEKVADQLSKKLLSGYEGVK